MVVNNWHQNFKKSRWICHLGASEIHTNNNTKIIIIPQCESVDILIMYEIYQWWKLRLKNFGPARGIRFNKCFSVTYCNEQRWINVICSINILDWYDCRYTPSWDVSALGPPLRLPDSNHCYESPSHSVYITGIFCRGISSFVTGCHCGFGIMDQPLIPCMLVRYLASLF